MTAPRWTQALLARVAPAEDASEVLGDLGEAHHLRSLRHGRALAHVLTGLETLDMARALLRERARGRRAAAHAALRASGEHGGGSASGGAPRFTPPPRGPFASISWLDVKLGARMLVKHPALSLVSALGMAVAVAIGAIGFGVIQSQTASSLTLDEGERVVMVQNTRGGGPLRNTHLQDFETWREGATTLTDLGAFRMIRRNVMTDESTVFPQTVVEMSAAGFRVARVPPLLGRYLVEADEQPGAPPVMVLGYSVWQNRFSGREDIVGQTIRLGATAHTIVGVMPEDFAFPLNNQMWTALRLDPLQYPAGDAPDMNVFARLAPGVDLEEAQTQLASIGERTAALNPETHDGVYVRVFPFAEQFLVSLAGEWAWLVWVAKALVGAVLVVIAINVAALVYARTATRAGELVVRSALGASRTRIATQMFAEALVLATAASALGLCIAAGVLEYVDRAIALEGGEGTPFWWDYSLSPMTAVYAFALAVVAALIIGVIPALGATRKQLRSGLSAGTAGSGLKLGRMWTTLIIGQVAIAVAVLPLAITLGGQYLASAPQPGATASSEILWGSLDFSTDPTSSGTPTPSEIELGARYPSVAAEVVNRLESDPAVSHVVLMRPAPWQDPDLRIVIEDDPSTFRDPNKAFGGGGPGAGWSKIGIDFTDAFEVPVLEGRAFEARDAVDGAGAVIVSRTFVDWVLGGGPAIGRRIRPDAPGGGWGVGGETGQWFTIVGVVPDFPPQPASPMRPEPKVYEPFTPGAGARVSVAVRVRDGNPSRYAPRMREIAASVDPLLMLDDLAPVDEIMNRGSSSAKLITGGFIGLGASVFLLAVAGLYALMSFTVVRRRREIGIRAALGGNSRSILTSVLRRALIQMAIGIVIGATITGQIDRLLGGGLLSGRAYLVLPGVALLMAGVGILAAWGPARIGLRIQPTEALRAE